MQNAYRKVMITLASVRKVLLRMKANVKVRLGRVKPLDWNTGMDYWTDIVLVLHIFKGGVTVHLGDL